MRWNPSISSFTEKDYEECVVNMEHGMFRINWSINEWEEARRGDMFFMMRVGDEKAGIVFTGQFLSDPYPSEDWAGSNRRRMYVDMIITNFVEPDAKPRVSLEKLQEAIPDFEWANGHSGVLLTEGYAFRSISGGRHRGSRQVVRRAGLRRHPYLGLRRRRLWRCRGWCHR